MCAATSGVEEGLFTGFIYTVLLRHVSDQINHQLFYHILWKWGNFVARL